MSFGEIPLDENVMEDGEQSGLAIWNVEFCKKLKLMYRVRVANVQIVKLGATGKIKSPYIDFPTSPVHNVSVLNPAPGN